MNQIFTTSDFNSVFNACDLCRKHQLMIGIIADTGMGKTTALKEYALRNNETFVVTSDKTMNARRFFVSVLKSMGVDFDGCIFEVINKISETLSELQSPLLIIDEAGKLNHSMILYLHVLREKTKANAGIVLAGMPYFKTNLIKQAERQKEGASEFYRRVNIWHELQGLSREETRYICDSNGIKTGFERYYNLKFGDLDNRLLLERILENNI